MQDGRIPKRLSSRPTPPRALSACHAGGRGFKSRPPARITRFFGIALPKSPRRTVSGRRGARFIEFSSSVPCPYLGAIQPRDHVSACAGRR